MLHTLEEEIYLSRYMRHTVEIPREPGSPFDYLRRYVPKDNITEEEKKWLRKWDKDNLKLFGYHFIVNYKDIK